MLICKGVSKRGQTSRRDNPSASYSYHIDEHKRKEFGKSLHGLDQGRQGQGPKSLRTSSHAN